MNFVEVRSLFLVAIVSSLVFASGCREEAAAERRPSPADPEEKRRGDLAAQDALRRAREAAVELGKTLRARVFEGVSTEGPVAALHVCAREAQVLTAAVGERTGVRVGRASLRLRNPKNAPPAWVEAWLLENEGRAPDRAPPVAQIVGDRARVILPIATDGPCLNCHGPKEALHPEVAASIAARYPMDRAVGYEAGSLRGALWAEADITSAR